MNIKFFTFFGESCFEYGSEISGFRERWKLFVSLAAVSYSAQTALLSA